MNRRHRNRKWNDAGGLTLLELIAAIFVISAGLFGILQTYLHVLNGTRTVCEHAIAFEAVQQELEAWKAAPCGELTAGPHEFRTTGSAFTRLHNATGSVQVSVPEGAPAGLTEVRVVLRWTGENGRTILKDLATRIACKP